MLHSLIKKYTNKIRQVLQAQQISEQLEGLRHKRLWVCFAVSCIKSEVLLMMRLTVLLPSRCQLLMIQQQTPFALSAVHPLTLAGIPKLAACQADAVTGLALIRSLASVKERSSLDDQAGALASPTPQGPVCIAGVHGSSSSVAAVHMDKASLRHVANICTKEVRHSCFRMACLKYTTCKQAFERQAKSLRREV